MTEQEIRDSLEKLRPDIPWAHYFEFGHQIRSITPEQNDQFYRKALGLGRLADTALDIIQSHTRRGAAAGLRVLDLACAEGAHSIALARAGAQVTGVEGRQLYVERATFAARALGVNGVVFRQADVRKVSLAELGTFDVVLCFGILHHLDAPSFFPFLRTLHTLTDDALIIYTHVSTPQAVERFRLTGPVESNGYTGYLFREHQDGASAQERIDQVRASLDNAQSFWATPESLYTALSATGFRAFYPLWKPHIFSKYCDIDYRPIIVARK